MARVRFPPLAPLRNNRADIVEMLKISAFSLFLGNFAKAQYSLGVELPIFYLLEINKTKCNFTKD